MVCLFFYMFLYIMDTIIISKELVGISGTEEVRKFLGSVYYESEDIFLLGGDELGIDNVIASGVWNKMFEDDIGFDEYFKLLKIRDDIWYNRWRN